MTDITSDIMTLANSVLLFGVAFTMGRHRPVLKAVTLAGLLALIVYALADSFGGLKVEAPISFRAELLWMLTALLLNIAAAILLVRRVREARGRPQ